MEWKALSARISLFPTAASSLPNLSAMTLFRSLWKTDPDNFQKHNNPLVPSVASGKINDLNMSCSIQPSRLDINIAPVIGEDNASFYLIEDMSSLRQELGRLISLLETERLLVSAARVALNLHVLVPQQSVRDANSTLMGIIPTRYGLRLWNEQDFFLQLNLPYKSTHLPDVEMNLITQWIASKFQKMRIAISGDLASSVTQTTTALDPEPMIASSVVFDINSLPGQMEFDPEQQTMLLSEAASNMWEKIMEMGLMVGESQSL